MSEKWMPKYGEVYYYISESLVAEVDCNEHTFTDKERICCANCFRTEAEAEAAAEKVKALLLSLHSEPVANCNQLPKLTAEVFDRPDCPAEATFAIVYQDGSASYMKGDPAKMKSKEMHWSYTLSSGIEDLGEIPGKFDPSDWKNSLVERPAKPPEWCKVGEWVYTCGCDYRKVESITYGIVCLSGGLNIPVGDIHSELVKARLRPYNTEEMKALVGKVICKGPSVHFVTGWENVLDGESMVHVNGCLYSANDLLLQFTIDNAPCGVLEHLEDGEWVK